MDHSWGYATDLRLRDENQDCHGVFEFPDFTLAVVCDGMGGHVGGAHASAIAVRTIHDTLRAMDVSDIPAALEEALSRANQAIYEAARKNHRLMGMGTTVVAAAITDDQAFLAHVGDSRAYLLRQGQVQQITRDHTMVNLFVDAELLTPEDAATHPEAHVLSRSLGVERTVDVELSEPVDLSADDVIFLCSDGVHGVITDWELGNVDWGAPHQGVQHVMDIVSAREGDDNATAVAVLLATSFEDVPPTSVPEPDRMGDAGHGSHGMTAVPIEDTEAGRTIIPDGLGDHDEYTNPPPQIGQPQGNQQPAPLPAPPSGQKGGYIVYDEAEPAPAAVPDVRKRQKAADAAANTGGNRQRTVLLAAIGVLMLGGIGLVGAAIVGVSMSGGSTPTPLPLEPQPPTDVVAHVDAQAMDPVPLDPSVDAVIDSDYLFKPVIPEAPRRLPHRPVEYTQPPPGGPAQWESVQAARNKNCAESVNAVARGMLASIDHATLYSQSWFCFNEVHQRPLLDAECANWEEFQRLIPNFEGPIERRADLPDEITRLPAWYQPAVDGVEFRLEAWQRSNEKDRFAVVIADLLGEPTVTDQLARDVLLIGQAAVGLSRVEDPNERVVAWWARRVYAATAAMNGPVGRLIEANRPELVPQIEALLTAATSPRLSDPDDPASKVIRVPEMVIDAYETAKGIRPPPTARKVAPTGPAKPIEPNLEDLTVDPAVVHRGKEITIESPK